MGESLVLQVSGIPTSLYYKTVRDRLLIHFLRRSNGGDGEVDVRYPTEEEGVAILTFGHEEVASRVLSRRHQLEIEGYTYPLAVSRPQCRGTQVSKPLMALSLDDTSAGEDGGSGSNGRPGYSYRDRSRPTYIKPNGPSQRRPKDTSSDDSTSIKKHPKSNITANLNLYSKPPEKIPADENRIPNRNSPLASNGKTADSSGLARHTTFASTQLGEDLPESRRPKDTFVADFSTSQSKPKSTIADEFISNPKYANSTIGDGPNFIYGQPKNTSTDEFNSNPNHSKSTIRDSTKFSSGQPKKTSTYELSSSTNYSKSTIRESTKFRSGQPKKTSTDEFNSSPNHSKSTTGDSTQFSSEQPKNTSIDELSSSTNHSKSTIRDSTKFNSGQPKNTSTDELNSNPKHSKSTLGNFKPGKPQNSSPDEFHLNPRNLEDLTARSSNRSSLTAAGWSSLSSPTGNSLPAINPKNHLDESSLSTEFFVDPAVHTYVSVFMKDTINEFLGLSDAEMKTETCEGYNRVILTSKSPHLSHIFYKAAREISDLFIKCQHLLRCQSIVLSNISADVTKKLQSYLFRCDIWSSANEERLQMIGPSEVITRFMEKWTSGGFDFLQGVSPASSGGRNGQCTPIHNSKP